jgi:4-amino-4-deoxy-L-arabinose transferase-like glycosyltransferase
VGRGATPRMTTRAGPGSGPPFPFETRDYFALAALLGIFLVTRLAWLAWNPQSVAYFEETHRWMVAHEWLHGAALPLLDYQADHYQGGSLVMALLTVPYFALFGESLLVLKLAAVTVSVGVLACLYVIGRKFFGRGVAVLAAVGYVAGPPLVAYEGLVVMGSHTESVLFSLLGILVFLHILYGARRPGTWALFGIVSGLGIWFCYTAGLSLIACALAWVLLERLPRPRELTALAAGLVLGLTPWLIYNAYYHFEGIVRVLQVFGMRGTVDTWEKIGVLAKLGRLLDRDLAYGLLSPMEDVFGPRTVWTLALLYGTPLLLGLAAAAARSLRAVRQRYDRAGPRPGATAEGEVVFVLYGFVFLAFFLASSFTVDRLQWPVAYRLFVPPAVLLLIPAAASAARACAADRLLYRVATAAALVFWLGAQATGDVGIAMHPRGVDADPRSLEGGYVCLGLLTFHKYPDDPARVVEVLEKLPDPERRRLAFLGVGTRMAFGFEAAPSQEKLSSALAVMPMADRLAALDGMIHFAHQRIEQVRRWQQAGYALNRYYTTVPARLETLLDVSYRERSRTQMALYGATDLRFWPRARLLRPGEQLRIAVSDAVVTVDGQRYPEALSAGQAPAAIRIGAWMPTGAALRIVGPQGGERLAAQKDLSVIERPVPELPCEIGLQNQGKRGVLIAGWLDLRRAGAVDPPGDDEDLLERYQSALLPDSPFRVVDGWHPLERAPRWSLHPAMPVWRWTSQRSAVAVFPNPHRIVGLHLEGMLPEDLAGERLRLEIAVDGEPIGVIEGQQDFAFTRVLEPELLGVSAWGDLELSVSRTVNPKHLGASDDARDLGVLLKRLDLEDVDLPSDGRIDLGAPEVRKYLAEGWSFDEHDAKTTFVWAVAKRARVEFALAEPHYRELELRVYPLPESLPSNLAVYVNDRKVSDTEITSGGWQSREIELPAGALKPGLNRIGFAFGVTASPATGGDRRTLAVAFDSIRLR